MFLQQGTVATAVRLKEQGSWALPHFRRCHGLVWDVVVGGCPILGLGMDSMTAVFDFESRGDF